MLTSRPNKLAGAVDVGILRLRLKEFAPKLMFCTTAEAEQQLSAFLDGFGAVDYAIDVEVDLDGSTMIKIAAQLADNGQFFFVPLYISGTVIDPSPSQLSLFKDDQPWS